MGRSIFRPWSAVTFNSEEKEAMMYGVVEQLPRVLSGEAFAIEGKGCALRTRKGEKGENRERCEND